MLDVELDELDDKLSDSISKIKKQTINYLSFTVLKNHSPSDWVNFFELFQGIDGTVMEVSCAGLRERSSSWF